MKPVLKFLTGSHSYNLANENSDVDTLTVFLLEPDEMFGLERTKVASQKIVEGQDDSAVEFSEYLRRLVAGNPSYVQTLFNWSENLVEFNLDFDRTVLRERLLSCLVAENVHRSFTGVATRMFKEYEQKGKNKSLSEAFRYLYVLENLLRFDTTNVFLTGGSKELFLDLRENGFDANFARVAFKKNLETCDKLLDDSGFGVEREHAFFVADNLSRVVYKGFYRLALKVLDTATKTGVYLSQGKEGAKCGKQRQTC